MGRLRKHRRVKSIDPHAKGGSTFGRDETAGDKNRNLAPDGDDKLPRKMREILRAKAQMRTTWSPSCLLRCLNFRPSDANEKAGKEQSRCCYWTKSR